MNERYIIDRVEGDFAVIEKENGDMFEILIENIKGHFEEGDIIINKDKYFEIDEDFTLRRKERIENRLKDMWKE